MIENKFNQLKQAHSACRVLAYGIDGHQGAWIQAEKAIHDQRKQAVALAEKSVRIGWTYAHAARSRSKMSASASGFRTAIICSLPRIIRAAQTK
jgi:hypothetical protein